MNYFSKNKKWMAYLILLTFLFTCVMPSNLSGWNSVAEAAETLNQIANDADYATVNYYKGTGTGTSAEAESGSAEEYQASTSKTITQVGENEFDITLQVMTTETLSEYEVPQDAAVVVVLDTSYSMLYKEDGTGKNQVSQNSDGSYRTTVPEAEQRITKAVAALNTFVSNYQRNMSGAAWLSVVTFNRDAETIKGWSNLKTDSTLYQMSSNPKVYAYTNIKAALNEANEQLQSSAISGVSNKYVILLSDGSPTAGSYGGYDDEEAAEVAATSLKNNAILYTVSYGSDGPTEWLEKHIATSGCALEAKNSANLNIALEKIYENIRLLANAWQVDDPMGDHITFLGFYANATDTTADSQSLSYSSNGKTVTYCTFADNKIDWNLRVTPIDSGSGSTNSYTIKYRVRLDNTFNGFNESNTFATNGKTTLDYAIMDEDGKLEAGPFEVEFDVPKVHGFLANVGGSQDIKFVKVDSENEAVKLAGVQFELKVKDTDATAHSASHTAAGEYVAGKTVTSDANGGFTFSNIPSGHTYTLTEKAAPTGYLLGGPWTVTVDYKQVTVTDKDGNEVELNDNNQFVIENEKNIVSISGTKTWVDGGKQHDNAREITLILTRTANDQEETVVAVPVWNGNTYTYNNLTKYSPEGYEYVYSVREVPVSGYTSTQDGNDFTNTIVDPANVTVSGTKTWVDGGKQHDNAEEITLTLTRSANGKNEIVSVLPTWNGNTYTFSGLDKYDAEGYEYRYTVTESKVEGYTSVQDGNNFVNTIAQDKVSVNGTKTWVAPVGTVYPTITINLLRDNVQIDSRELTRGLTTYIFDNLDKYDLTDGHEYRYTVTESKVEGFTSTQNGNNFVNTIEQDKVSVSGIKTWIAPAGTVHPTITINLLRDGQKVDSKQLENGTTEYSFINLDKYDLTDGHVYNYTVEEVAVAGYTSSQNGNNFVNTIEQAKVSVSGTKTWIAPAGTVHPTITINLLRDGKEVAYRTLVNGVTEYSFTNLDKYDLTDGHVYEYTVTEDEVEGYTSTQNGNNFVNTIDQAKTEVTVNKTWIAPEGTEHPDITINLLQDGVEIDEVVLHNGELSYTFEELDVYDLEDGHVYAYTVTEDDVEGYTSRQNGNNFTNTIAQEYITVSGTKVWCDNSDQDGVRPESITVNLLADDEVADSKAVMGEGDSWSYEFTELPKYSDDGAEIVYTITENEVDYYTTEVDGYDITNTHITATTQISGVKVWDDNDNAAGVRPESIEVELFADGEPVARTTAAAIDWSYEFTNLPMYRDGGIAISYQVVETPVDNYVATYEKVVHNDGVEVNITNTYVVEDPEFVTIKGTKVWNDNNDAAGKRPDSITVNLFNGGAEPVATTTASITTDWTYAFTDLPKADEDGKEYVYTVTETPVPEYRSVVVETTAGFDIYNSLITAKAGEIQVGKLVTGDKAPENGVYKFVLKINATKPDWTSLKVYELLQLEKAYEAAVEAYNDAQKAWDEAVAKFKDNARELNTTGSALRFAMAEEVTSPSGYEYLFIDDDARMTSTTSSSYDFDDYAVNDEAADEEIVNPVVEAISRLAKDFNRASGAFFEALLDEAEVTTPSALGFMRDDAQDLLDEADRLFEAKALMEATSASVYEFKNSPEVTTASAVTLFITDADGKETVVTTSGAYQFEFELTGVTSLVDLAKELFKFRFEATTGSVITFSIEEVEWVEEGYEGTSIDMNGNEIVASGVATGDYVLTTGSAYDFVFINDYEDETGGGYTPPPYTPPYVPPTDPDIEIEDPEVPTTEPPVIVPGEEIEEPEIPLGDAPKTGDETNAVPFMALMMFALCGLVITRRKFN